MLSFFAIVPVIIAILLYLIPFKKFARVAALVLQAGLTGGAFYLFFLCRQSGGELISAVGNFTGAMGIVLKADTLSSVFVGLASFIFLIAVLYSFTEDVSRLFWFFLFLWQGLLNAIFLSRDLFNIFVLIEVVTVVATTMIMFNRDNRSIYDGMVYLMVNTVAIQFYLFGIGYIYKLTGVLDMTAAAQTLATLDKAALVLPFSLIMTAVCLKCALVPLFSWLPKAYRTLSAPAAVSAILSGIHIKSSVYLFIRCQALFESIDSTGFFLILGIITGVAGFMMALAQSDIRLILAYSTVSQVGLIIAGLNLPGAYSYTGSLYHIINHALFKCMLFLCAGVLERAYGTRDVHQIRGVLKRMPLVGVAMAMGILGITGAPFFNGIISKYFILSGANGSMTAAILFINLGTITVFIKYAAMLFGTSAVSMPAPALKIDKCKQAAVLTLGALCLAGGVLGERFIEFLFGVRMNVSLAGYLEKTAYFIASAGVGFLLYKYYLQRSKLLARIKGFEIGFRGSCVLIGVFFAVVLLASNLFMAGGGLAG